MIVREGNYAVGVTLAAAIAVSFAYDWRYASLLWILFGVLGYLYYDRKPSIPLTARGLVSPVRGTITAIENRHDDWLEREVTSVRIKTNWPGWVTICSCMEAQVKRFYTRQCPYPEPEDPSIRSRSPSCYAILLEYSDDEEGIMIVASSNWGYSRAKFYAAPGEKVGRGQICGFMYFASYVDVLLPANTYLECEIGQSAHAGETLLGKSVPND